jgi:hypothetical protein
VICVYVDQRKQQDSCEREEQLLTEGWREGSVAGDPTLVHISVDHYDNNYIIPFSINNDPLCKRLKIFIMQILLNKHM